MHGIICTFPSIVAFFSRSCHGRDAEVAPNAEEEERGVGERQTKGEKVQKWEKNKP